MNTIPAVTPVPSQVSPYQCSPCDCGFSAPQSERSITLIISNVVWALFFVISEVLGYTKKFKTKSISELVTHLLTRHNEQPDKMGQMQEQQSHETENEDSADEENEPIPQKRIPRATKVKKKKNAQTPLTSEQEEWQAYKDWRDLREFRKYINDRRSLQESYTPERGNTKNSTMAVTSKPTTSNSMSKPNEAELVEIRKRTPSNDGDAK